MPRTPGLSARTPSQTSGRCSSTMPVADRTNSSMYPCWHSWFCLPSFSLLHCSPSSIRCPDLPLPAPSSSTHATMLLTRIAITLVGLAATALSTAPASVSGEVSASAGTGGSVEVHLQSAIKDLGHLRGEVKTAIDGVNQDDAKEIFTAVSGLVGVRAFFALPGRRTREKLIPSRSRKSPLQSRPAPRQSLISLATATRWSSALTCRPVCSCPNLLLSSRECD